MKQIIPLLLSVLFLLSFSSCGAASWSQSDQAVTSATPPGGEETRGDVGDENATKPVRIKLTVNGREAVVEMLDNAAAADFLSMLPLTQTFEDYNDVEKISNLPRKLTLGDAPTSCDPDVGSFAYYAPWGNLSVFYRDFRQSNNLIPLGRFVSGIEIFAETDGTFSVRIERQEQA